MLQALVSAGKKRSLAFKPAQYFGVDAHRPATFGVEQYPRCLSLAQQRIVGHAGEAGVAHRGSSAGFAHPRGGTQCVVGKSWLLVANAVFAYHPHVRILPHGRANGQPVGTSHVLYPSDVLYIIGVAEGVNGSFGHHKFVGEMERKGVGKGWVGHAGAKKNERKGRGPPEKFDDLAQLKSMLIFDAT